LGVSGPSSFGIPSGFAQLCRVLPFLAILAVSHLGKQCTFGVSGILREVPKESESGFFVDGHVTQDLADEALNLPSDNPSARCRGHWISFRQG
jgi:hypothetical protein